uniref:Uncharacterized protein n=1 Tax=Tanacetum cinerariifolium TaxID=118510 RepID=A0A6L2M496_TANCI|nr:hypothetical protein [Tanacetum cinerariifolium]
MPPKPDLVFNTAPTAVETDHSAFDVSDYEDESKTKAPQIVPSFVQSTEQVKSHRLSVQHVETSIPADTPKPASPQPTSNGKRRNKKACFVCKILDHLIKDCDYHEKKMAKPTARNHANRGYHKQPVSVAVPKSKVTRPRHATPIVTKTKSPTRSGEEMEDLKQQYLDELKHLSNFEYRDEIKIAELMENFNGMSIEIRKKKKLQQLEQWAYLSTHPLKRLNSFCYDDDDDEDYTLAVIPSLSIEDPDNSLSMGDEHLDTIPATESNEFIKSSVENLILIPSESEGIPDNMCDVPFHDNSSPLDVSKDQFEDFSDSNDEFSSIDDESFAIDNIDYVEASPLDSKLVSSEVMEIVIPKVGGIDDDILLTVKDDILREKLLNVNLLIAKIEALNDNPTLSSDFKTKYSSTSFDSLLEETNTFDNSLPEFETFCFDVEEISSGSTTTYFDISLPEYEAFYDDHVKEISSGSPTTHSDSSLYALSIFDLLINPFPPAGRSDFYEFADELIPFISFPEYDCFLFKVEPNSRDFTKDVVEDISPTKEPRVPNALPTQPTLQ